MNKIEAILLGGCILLIMLLIKCQKIQYREGAFAGPGVTTWDDWDNYDKNMRSKREYWSQWDPEGGWQGNPYSPQNNPGGYGFGAAANMGKPGAFPGGYGPYAPRPSRQTKKDINLAHASDDELSYAYRSNIMR